MIEVDRAGRRWAAMTVRSMLDMENTMADGRYKPGMRGNCCTSGGGLGSMSMGEPGVCQVLNPNASIDRVGSARGIRIRCQQHRSRIHRDGHRNWATARGVQGFGLGVFRLSARGLAEAPLPLRCKESEWVRWLQANGPGAGRK